MRNLKTLLLLMCLTVSMASQAGPVTESQAMNIAQRFMLTHAMPSTNLKMAHKAPRLGATTSQDKASSYYVFNNGAGRGYVIVAGDDRAPAVLGYSDQGTFDNQDIPAAMQNLLEGYAAQIAALDQGMKAAPRLTAGRPISPMIPAAWSQNNPYNILLPYLPSGAHAYVGCVATALSQVMYYWKWPARPTQPIAAYTSQYDDDANNVHLTYNMPALPVIDFSWSAMQNTYQTTDTASEAALAAATLCLYSAQAVQMNFKPSASGATTASIANFAATYFDYDANAHMESRSNYNTQSWSDLIYSELSAGRPVIFSGRKKSGGHAFICDGYDGNGMYHFNWGWNGSSNGYFLLNIINPDLQGTGSASGAYGYIMEQSALVGFQPNKGGSLHFELTATDVTLNDFKGTRESADEAFSATVSGLFNNYTADTIAVRYGWGLFQNGELVEELLTYYSNSLRPGYHFTHTNKVLNFGEGITSGTYRIVPMYSEISPQNWRPCPGSDLNYIEVTIDGNNCTFTSYGTAGTPNYTINDIAVTGNMHNGRPFYIDVNMTNNGTTNNKLLYMFADGKFASAGYVGLEPGETGDIHYTYLFENAGDHTVTWSWDDKGADPIASRVITINAMPAASLTATVNVLNVTDATNKVITSDKFSFDLTVTNSGTTPYDEDISATIYKNTKGNSGTSVQSINTRVQLAPGETKTLRFDLDNVIDGWRYFVKTYYYSSGTQTSLKGSTTYTIVFPEMPQVMLGDVNGDGEVGIKDVSVLIDYLLSGDASTIVLDNADVSSDGEVGIKDVSALIDLLLSAN